MTLLKILCLILLLFPFQAFAEDDLTFSEIKLIGNTKTKEYILLNELGFSVNESLNNKKLFEGLENIRNTNLFSTVTHKIVNTKLLITVQERWTTIPIFKVSSGGGVSQVTLGVFDPNLLGHYLESGVQYLKLEDTSSGVVWFKNPRLFGSRDGLDIQFWKTNRIRTKYQQGIDQPIPINGFLHSRSKFYLGHTKEWMRDLKSRLYYEYNDDSFSDKFVTDDIKLIINTIGLPSNTTFHIAGAGLDLGIINYNNEIINGSMLSADIKYALSEKSNIKNFTQFDLNYAYYKTFFKDHTFAQRLMAGVTTTRTLQYWYYLGGLDRIRGFSDNRFAGNHFLLSNTEWRVPVWRSKWLIAQGVGFLDVVSRGEEIKELGTLDGASAGLGARFILPKIYRFVLRFDYAKPLKADDDMNISFGVQQFF